MNEAMIKNLIKTAIIAMDNSYSPYSNFKVGAALLCEDEKIITGCNIENAAYTPTNCAERTAFFKAVSENIREFKAICVVGGKDGVLTDFTAPCGVCRQVMAEFCDVQNFEIILAKSETEYKVIKLCDLLPLSFGPDNLKG